VTDAARALAERSTAVANRLSRARLRGIEGGKSTRHRGRPIGWKSATGLDDMDRRLRVLIDHYDGGPVGVETMPALASPRRSRTCTSLL
jgi:hypothetical protein